MKQPMPESTSATRRSTSPPGGPRRSRQPAGPTTSTPQAWISPESRTTLPVTTPTATSIRMSSSMRSIQPGVSTFTSSSSCTQNSPDAASSAVFSATTAPAPGLSRTLIAGSRPLVSQRRSRSRLPSVERSSTASSSTSG